MKRIILIITFLIIVQSSYSQTKYNFLVQDNNYVYIYDFTKNSFTKILKLNTGFYLRSKQIEDTLKIYENLYSQNFQIHSTVKHSLYLPLNKIILSDTTESSDEFFLSVIKNKKILRKDTTIFVKYKRPRESFCRIINNKLISASEGDLFIFVNNSTTRYLKHYVNTSIMVAYANWGYVFPEITKDGKTLYFIDTYKFRYEGKHKLFNRRKDENYRERKYCYLIVMDFETKETIKTIKIPFILTGTNNAREFRNLQLSPDDKYLFFEAYPESYLYDTETEKLNKLPDGYHYITWIK